MRKYFGVLAVLLLMGSSYAQAQDTQRIPLAIAVDLDGEATDDDQVVTAANGVLADAGSYVISASPDSCRVVNMTINDVANITAGTMCNRNKQLVRVSPAITETWFQLKWN